MSAKMSLAPLFYTLAQVKFNPIGQIAVYVPQLQEQLRLNGYPDFREDTQTILSARQLDKDQPDIQNQQVTRWSFSNTQQTEGYLLSSDGLVFHTTNYDSFEGFSNKLLKGLQSVHEAIRLSYIDRIGLRYLNAIVPDPNKSVGDYLTPTLLGFLPVVDGVLRHNAIEVMTEIDDGTLVARSVIMDNTLALPPDLYPLQLKLQPKHCSLTGRVAVLDMDYFVSDPKFPRFDFAIDPIATQLAKSHAVIKKIFYSSVTDYARTAWR